jgi:endonuclease YncB( thermonuclease family)
MTNTLDVIVQGKRIRVRILYIDAPEQKQPIGHCSRQSLIAICGGEPAQIDGDKHDRNGRMLTLRYFHRNEFSC